MLRLIETYIDRGKRLDLTLTCGHMTSITKLPSTNIQIGKSRARCEICAKAEIERELAGYAIVKVRA